MKKGLLLLNLGTPDQPTRRDVWRFLAEFLADKRVINIPTALRYALLYLIILPFRLRQTTRAYQSIWTVDGSPLLHFNRLVEKTLQHQLGDAYQVALAMRYGNPSIKHALHALESCSELTILPLYPQYSSAATGSSIEHVLRLLAPKAVIPSLRIIREFYDHPAYLYAQAERIRPYLVNHDYLLLSYHGLPEAHLTEAGCLSICQTTCPIISNSNHHCYRAQCFQTSAGLAECLSLTAHQYSTSFQSRLGKTPWIKPYTDEVLQDLIHQGVKRIAVCCPSFTSDCLETIEEIGMRAEEQWRSLGGEQLTLVPSLNEHPLWIRAIQTIIE